MGDEKAAHRPADDGDLRVVHEAVPRQVVDHGAHERSQAAGVFGEIPRQDAVVCRFRVPPVERVVDRDGGRAGIMHQLGHGQRRGRVELSADSGDDEDEAAALLWHGMRGRGHETVPGVRASGIKGDRARRDVLCEVAVENA